MMNKPIDLNYKALFSKKVGPPVAPSAELLAQREKVQHFSSLKCKNEHCSYKKRHGSAYCEQCSIEFNKNKQKQ